MTYFKEVQISQIFDIEKWKSLYTNTYITWNIGDFSVFSSQTTNNWEIWKINTYDYDNSCITWTTDWVHAWTVFIRDNIKFSMTTHCWALILKKEYLETISLRYIHYFLSVFLKQYAIWTDNKRLTSWMIKSIFIKIPTNKNWEFDLEKQKEIAWKYEKLEKLKDRIRIMKEDLENQNISLEDTYIWEEIRLNKLFEIKQWNAFYTKKRILENNWIWDIPVYSSNTKEDWFLVWIKKDFIKEKDLYYQNCLTWSIDWYAWKIFARNTENINNDKFDNYYFTINNHCWILLPKLCNLYLPFIKIILQHKFFTKAKWYWNNKLWNNQIQDIFLKIPTNKNWEFDLEKQKEIASKYEKIEKIQKNLIEELEYLEKVRVEI